MEKDIEKAIEIEKQYLEYRKKGEEPFHLVDAIKDYGFETLQEYFKEKKEYEFTHLGFSYEECVPETCLSQVFTTIMNDETKFLFMLSNTTFVFNGSDDFNEDFCKANNIPVYKTNAKGGTIVSSAGDASFCICVPTAEYTNSAFILDHIAAILSKYTNGIAVNGNDILWNSKKILGSTSYSQNNMFALIAHMSFKDNSELISNICRKPNTEKTPGYLIDITPEQFRQEVLKWLRIK